MVKLFALVKAMCIQHERYKTHFTKSGGVKALCGYLDRAKSNEMLLKQLAFCFCVLTINDDPHAIFSQAQDAVKGLVDRDLIPSSLDVLRQFGCNDAAEQVRYMSMEVLVNWLAILKQLAVTEENCKQIADVEGLTIVEEVMKMYEHSAPVAKRGRTVFRNVAAADDLKRVICNREALNKHY